MVPTDQRLNTENRLGGRVDLWLVFEVQTFVGIDRFAEAIEQRVTLARPFSQLRRVELVGVSTGILGAVHGDIGALEEILRCFAVERERRDPHRCRDHDVLATNSVRIGHGTQDLRRHPPCIFDSLPTLEDDGELVSAEACDRVRLAYASQDSLSDLSEERIPDRMAEPIVDILESVEVEEHEGDHRAVASCPGHRVFEPI